MSLLLLAACSPFSVVFPAPPDDSAIDDTDTDDTDDTDTDTDDTDSGDTDSGDDTGPCVEVWYRDADGDSFGIEADSVTACEAPSDYVERFGDCDDAAPAVHPGAVEACNAVDDDCDGATDEAGATGETPFYADVDGDDWGDPDAAIEACGAAAGYVPTPGDCDDADPTIHPDAAELAHDWIDNDCADGADPMSGATEASWTLLGPEANAGIGGAFAAGDDLDGDGSVDVAIGAPLYGSGAVAFHDADTFDGLFAGGWQLTEGENDDDGFGSALALPQADSGASYLAIGAPGYDTIVPSRADAGMVYVCVWEAAEGSGTIAGASCGTVYGHGGSALLGSALASGDVDGDGTHELLMGAPGTAGAGAVYLLTSEWNYWEAGEGAANDLAYSATGTTPDDEFGSAVTITDDLDGDGRRDLVVCGPGYALAAGGCWLVAGGETPLELSGEIGSVSAATFVGALAGDGVGGGAIATGDFDGDSVTDLAIGAPGYDGGTGEGGAVAIFTGGALSGTRSIDEAPILVTGTGAFGTALAVGDDADGDGLLDLLVGAPEPGVGAVFRLSGLAPGEWSAPGSEIASWSGEAGSDRFGGALAIQDLDGDALSELIVAAAGHDDPASNAGKVYVIPGRR